MFKERKTIMEFDNAKLDEIIERVEDALLKEKPGSEAHKVLAEQLKLLYAIKNENYRAYEFVYKAQEEVELAKRKFEEDVKRADAEFDLKEAQRAKEARLVNRVDWIKIAAITGMGLTVIMNTVLEVTGHVPGFKWIQSMKIFEKYV